jgi:hypothetical protein
MVKDLLPLYYDDVCSDSSKKIVEEHLLECDSCRNDMKKFKNNAYETSLKTERDNVVGHFAKKIKGKSFLVGLWFSLALCVPILVCLIINLAVGRSLDWFFIVLTSLMVLASLIAVPLIAETKKGLWTLGSFTGSLLLLLMTVCLYVGGDWFFVASIPILFGLSVIFLPYVFYTIPLKGFASRHKGLLVMLIDTALLYATVIVAMAYYVKNTAYEHSNTTANNDWRIALLSVTINLILPWFLFIVIRYLKVNRIIKKGSRFIKAGICVIAGTVYYSFLNDIQSWIIDGEIRMRLTDVNFSVWSNEAALNGNITMIIFLTGLVVGIGLLIAGIIRKQKSKV